MVINWCKVQRFTHSFYTQYPIFNQVSPFIISTLTKWFLCLNLAQTIACQRCKAQAFAGPSVMLKGGLPFCIQMSHERPWQTIDKRRADFTKIHPPVREACCNPFSSQTYEVTWLEGLQQQTFRCSVTFLDNCCFAHHSWQYRKQSEVIK